MRGREFKLLDDWNDMIDERVEETFYGTIKCVCWLSEYG